MASFADLKKNRKSSFDKLSSDLDKLAKGNERSKDETFWSPTVDKAGNGYAVLRFLPAHGSETSPYVRYWDHGFQGPTGKWYIENSLTSIGQEDPVAQFNGKLWNVSQDDNSSERKQARKQKRRLHFVSNILVLNDSSNPENNGKVFKFKYGKKIFDKLNEKMNPQFEDEQPMNPFDMWEGANFKLKIRQVEGYRNYDKSEFDVASPISDNDEYLEEIWKQTHSLDAILAPENFKSYDDLKKKLDQVLGLGDERTPAHSRAEVAQRQSKRPSWEDDADSALASISQTGAKSASPSPFGSSDDEDESLGFFQRLADDD